MATPRSEYPRPQFVRDRWLCLNGTWEFEIDSCDTGFERGVSKRSLESKITVPFCPESKLSGVHHTDFMLAVWYRKVVKIPADWKDQRLLLHFGAVDYDSTVWVNDMEVTRHRGGFTSFSVDITDALAGKDEATIVVRARDDWRPPQPRGKQSMKYENHGCLYYRTTGIWQTVWLEPVPEISLCRSRITPNVGQGAFVIDQPVSKTTAGLSVKVTVNDGKKEIASAETDAGLDFSAKLFVQLPKESRKVWSCETPFLYDLKIELRDASGKVLDTVKSYAGLRSVSIDGKAIKINGKSVFQRLVLDQGFYPDGLWTAPSDAALKKDIELSMAAGFNGARLHQKVFEERFLYHADKLGYLVWGEFGDWGCSGFGASNDHQAMTATYITQWCEAIERDYSHPSIIGWCPLNETWQLMNDRFTALDDVTRGMFLATKAMDTSRPVLDTSGYAHRVPETDVYDCHDYEQVPEKFATNQAPLAGGKPFQNLAGHEQQIQNVPYRGQPFFVSEFGGIWWNPDVKPGDFSWGYGARPKTLDEFYERFEALCKILLDNQLMFGYCYTQLTDVFQEQNGIFRFDRAEKFDMKRIKAAQTRKAAIEE